MTLANFKARSTWLIYAESCLRVIEGKNFRKLANGQNVYDFEKEIDPRGYSDPALGLYTCI